MTRYKPVPEPSDVRRVSTVQSALPLVPGSVDDCCRRLQERAAVPSRQAARQWLPFLVALGLAGEDDGSYYRERVDPERERLAARFRDRVYGVPELLETVAAAGPLTVEAAFEATREVVPRWERNRDPDWEATWRDRTRRCLEWGVVLGLLERDGETYTRAP